MKNIKALVLLIGLFIFSSCQPYEMIDESREFEEESEVQPEDGGFAVEDWIEERDTAIIEVYPGS